MAGPIHDNLGSFRFALALLLAAALAMAACGDDGGGATRDSGLADGAVAHDGALTTDASRADAAPAVLDELLAALRADPSAALAAQADAGGWPALVAGGRLFVTGDTSLTLVSGDHDGWAGTALTLDAGFNWVVIEVAAGSRYKFTDESTYVADPWSRAYEWDENGLMSMVAPSAAHLERFFAVSDGVVAARTVRVWVPAAPASHVLYAHDGQNLFKPGAAWGGWKLDETAPAAMMIVGIDNTPARINEYTHVTDDPDELGGGTIGGDAADYAAFVQGKVRSLIASHYGEPAKVGTMGSSLGGLVSLYLAHAYPDQYLFAASLSGTAGWGSMGTGITNQTIIELYAAAGHRSTRLYIDSGGQGTTCADSDGDGINDDDASSLDNYCENLQLRDVLSGAGYVFDTDLWHWHEPGGLHNEAAWAARVFRPLGHFAAM